MNSTAGPTLALRLLAELDSLRHTFGPAAATRRREILTILGGARLPTARAVERFHEVLCWARAYPDDRSTLSLVERLLEGFAARSDLHRARAALVNSGLAGCDIRYHFFAAMAGWLADRWPERLKIDWSEMHDRARHDERLDKVLSLITTCAESPGIDDWDFGPREWLRRLSGHGTDATLLLRGLAAAGADDFVREYLYERLDLDLVLRGGPDGPSRTLAHHARCRPHFRPTPLRSDRPNLRSALRARPHAVRVATPAEGRALVDLARESMVTRSRDLDVFAYGDPNDVRLIDWGEGLQFALIGFVPERRLLLECVYGALTLQSGVPIGYVLFADLFGSCETAYNVFETFRGGEAAHVYGRVLATARHLFGSDSFTVMPYQLGDNNEEAQESGAWWFYQKLGLRPKDRATLALMRRELAAMRRNPRHRSSIATLQRLARECMYFHAGAPRRDIIGLVDIGTIGLRVSTLLAQRFGSDRVAAVTACEREATALLGVRPRGWNSSERLWLRRWAPLVLALPGVSRWSVADRRELARVIRLKGGRCESEYTRVARRHRRLWPALRELARSTRGTSGPRGKVE